MAEIKDLMGLGLGPFLARRVGVSSINATAQGASLASATQLNNHSQIAYVISTNSGSGLKLPAIGGDGCTLTDMIIVANFLGAAIQVYASNSCTITGSGASASGNTGFTVATCNQVMFFPVTATSWIAIKAGSA